MADTSVKKVKRSRASVWIEKFKAADKDDKKRLITDLLFNNAMYIIIAIAVVFIAIKVPAFLSVSSIVNIVSLTAAKLPIALGIAGCIVLTGTDISAGRCVGLTACVAASLLQMTGYANKMFPNLNTMPLFVVFHCGYRNRCGCRSCKRFLCSKVQASSVYRYSFNSAYRFRYCSYVPYDRRQQRSNSFGS